MHLRQIFYRPRFRRDAVNILRFQHKAARIVLPDLKGAERTVRTADIGEVDMPVHRIKDLPPALFLLHPARAGRQKQ